MRTPVGPRFEYVTPDAPDHRAGSPERDAQAAFFLRRTSRAADGSGVDVQIA
jgi:hypothetical protein